MPRPTRALTRIVTETIAEIPPTGEETLRNGFHPMKCQLYRGLCVCCPQYFCEKRKI